MSMSLNKLVVNFAVSCLGRVRILSFSYYCLIIIPPRGIVSVFSTGFCVVSFFFLSTALEQTFWQLY